MTPGIPPSALRARLRRFIITPGDFVSLHAGVAARADQRLKLERLCRYIQQAGNLGKAPVAHAERQRPVPAEDAFSRGYDTRYPRTTGFHCPAGSAGIETVGQPGPFP
jgi:hypothetical protein